MVYSISVYKNNKKGYILVMASGTDKQGIGRTLDNFKKLEQPYNAIVLAGNLKHFFEISKNAPVIENVKALVSPFERATGIKGWSKFSKEHILVSSSFDTEKGYRFAPLKRVRGGGYLGEEGDPVIEIGIQSTDEEIGEAVMRAFSFLE